MMLEIRTRGSYTLMEQKSLTVRAPPVVCQVCFLLLQDALKTFQKDCFRCGPTWNQSSVSPTLRVAIRQYSTSDSSLAHAQSRVGLPRCFLELHRFATCRLQMAYQLVAAYSRKLRFASDGD